MRRPPRDRIHVMDGFAIWRVAFVGSMIAVSAFILEAAAAARAIRRIYPYRAVADSGHRPVVLYAELPRIGWILVNQSAGQQRDLDRQRVLLLLQLLIIYAPLCRCCSAPPGCRSATG